MKFNRLGCVGFFIFCAVLLAPLAVLSLQPQQGPLIATSNYGVAFFMHQTLDQRQALLGENLPRLRNACRGACPD